MLDSIFNESKKFINPYVFKMDEYSEYIEYKKETINSHKGIWSQFFKNDNPIFFEIGSGAGNFLVKHAELDKGRNFIGLEIRFKRLVYSGKKSRKRDLKNIVFLRRVSEEINDCFGENEISGVYINFPEPWEKTSKVKHRVVKEELFEHLNLILRKGAKIYLKTDHIGYYDYVLELVRGIKGYKVVYSTDDLYNSEKIEGNIPTEFEDLFVKKGMTIKYIEIEKEV